jgi:hypothetical protein
MVLKHLLSWLLLALVAVLNGVVRQGGYAKVLSELSAHQVSTVTGIVATGAVGWLVGRRWPLETANQAWLVGCAWLVFTIAFEFGFGHYVAGHSWQRLLGDYQLLNGRVWSLFLLWVTLMPYLYYRLAKRRAQNAMD